MGGNHTHFRLPSGVSAVGLLGSNNVYNGDTFAEDGWVYDSTGTRTRKWFGNLEGARIWEPKLNDLTELEKRCWRVVQREQQALKERWQTAFAQWSKAKVFYGKRKGDWVVFDCSDRGVGFQWVNKQHPKKGKHRQDLVDLYWKTEGYLQRRHAARALYHDALDRAVANMLYKHPQLTKDMRYEQKFHVILNGRSYWYAFSDAYRGLRCFCRPEHTSTIEVSLGGAVTDFKERR